MDNTPLFVENDSRFCVDITSTKDSKFITVNSNSRTSSEARTYLFKAYLFLFEQDKLMILCAWFSFYCRFIS